MNETEAETSAYASPHIRQLKTRADTRPKPTKGNAAKQPEPKPTALTTVSEIRFEGQSADVLPPLALRFTSGTTYRLLEVFRRLPKGKKGITHYSTLMRLSGIRSPVSLSKAIKELRALGIITAERVQGKGKATGLAVEYLGLPNGTADAAQDFFRTSLIKRRDGLDSLVKEIEGGD